MRLQSLFRRPLNSANPQRVLWRWWRRQSPAKQDRFATLGPLLSVLLFLAAIVMAFWYLRSEEYDRALEAVQRDTEVAQQQFRLRLLENQEQLSRLARETLSAKATKDQFIRDAATFTRERSEVISVLWVNARSQLVAAHVATVFGDSDLLAADASGKAALGPVTSESMRVFTASKIAKAPVYSKVFENNNKVLVIQTQVPIWSKNEFLGAIVAEYSVDQLFATQIPTEIKSRHTLMLVDQEDHVWFSSGSPQLRERTKRNSITYAIPLPPLPNDIMLKGNGYLSSVGLVGNTLFWMVLALSVLTVWMLLGTWKHMRRRLQIQTALVSETNFRRAMENSMLTGMRAVDMEGRITYVNPAFCAMTGFSESDLIGLLPPFPHWPPESAEEAMRLFRQELKGKTPAGGIEVKVMRKDGSRFDARMYVSALIDAKGVQNGWMTSMTNITEAKRIRDQLSASHERFTTVLEGLEAAVSVISTDYGELLFTNRSYRFWFGADPQGHMLLSGPLDPEALASLTAAPGTLNDQRSLLADQYSQPASINPAVAEMREVHIERLDKWFDVRSRYLQWTDGRLAQITIATDITAKRRAEEQAALQAEKAQMTSRLMTMGEMASTVAHELNQPLTAISNYCTGIISRVKSNNIQQEDLIAALEKTSKQAHRAGQIIHRIRAFVKKSEPQRTLSSAQAIVDDTIELANIEMKRRSVTLITRVEPDLPSLMVDPILIEQVLLNLLKNAADAIDNAKLPSHRRKINLTVQETTKDDEGHVIEFSITDQGPGIPEGMMNRLYEAFFSTKQDGLGIGLNLCRSIIESHQGRIRAENLYNQENVSGCRFTFTLPVASSSELDASASSTDRNADPQIL